MGNSYHLNKAEREMLLEIAKKYKYRNQTELAQAIVKQGYKGSEDNARTYLNQILNGKRGASKKLIEVLSKALKNDPEISFLKKSQEQGAKEEIKVKRDVETGLKKLLDNYFTRLYDLFNSSDLEKKTAIINGLENIIKKE